VTGVSERSVRGFLASVDVIPVLKVVFQFNPATMQDAKRVDYTEQPAGEGAESALEYTGAGLRRLTFTLQLHGLEQGHDRLNPTPVDNGVATDLAVLRSFLYPRSTAWAQLSSGGSEGWLLARPPRCIFGFGTRVLHCYVTGLTVTEEQYSSSLTPVRAKVAVTLTVVEEDGDPLYRLDTEHRLALAAAAMLSPVAPPVPPSTTLGQRE
jgi:hypothetical protein